MSSYYYTFFITLLLAIIFITDLLSKNKFRNNSSLKYTKVDLENQGTGLLTNSQFKEEVGQLIKDGYQLTSEDEVFDFVNHKNKLSEKSVVVVMDDNSTGKVRSVLPHLIQHKVNVIFFMPLVLSM